MDLAAYVLTQNIGRATRVSERLEYGLVGINTSSFTGPPVPFGGWKQSGLGREGSHHGCLNSWKQNTFVQEGWQHDDFSTRGKDKHWGT